MDSLKMYKNKNINLKQSRLLHEVRRRGTMSRLTLSRRLGISNSRVCELTQTMVDCGIFHEEISRQERRGRSGVPLGLNPSYGHIIGFDMEALRMRLVVVDFAGSVVWQARQNLMPPENRQHLIDQILDFIEQQVNEQIRPAFPELLGMGLAAAGVIDSQRGMILHYDLVAFSKDLPLCDLVENRIGLSCVMEDNIRALTLAEWNNGAAHDFDHFICLAVRSGVGAGIVLNGKLLTGAHGLAGEVGYLPIQTRSGWKPLHEEVSEHALGVDIESDTCDLPNAKATRAGETLGAQLAMLAAVIDPQAIVLAGGLLKPDGPLWQPVLRNFRRLALPELAERVQILPAQLGPYAAAVGATHRCFQELFPIEE